MSIRVRYALPMRVVSPTLPRLAAAIGVVLLVAACAADSTPPPTFPPPTVIPAATPGASGSASALPTGSASASPSNEGQLARPDLSNVHVTLAPVVTGLDAPLFVVAANDGSGRLFVPEQGGVIRIVRDAALEQAPFIDLSDRVLAGGERGLLGLAFPPGFGPERPQLFVDYTDRDGNTTVSELF